MDNKFYVYVHRKKTDGKPFYVGKGTGNRAYISYRRNSYWKNVVAKHGFYVEIVFENLEESEAFQLEKDTILEFEYFGYSLTNLTRGGEGVSGKIVEDSTRKILGEQSKTRWDNPDYKKKLSDTQKIAQGKRSKANAEIMKTKWQDEEFRAMMIEKRRIAREKKLALKVDI